MYLKTMNINYDKEINEFIDKFIEIQGRTLQ